MSVKKSATPETVTVNMVPLKDLYIGENIGRDQTLGLKGHTEESIRRLSFSIKEVGYVIQPITIGPKGYRDDNHKETPVDKYPVLAGVGRVLSVNRLSQENPADPRWKVIPARIQGEVDTKQAELISLHENAVRFAPTSLGWADGMARLAYMGKTDQQVAEMYNVTPAEVSSYKLLRQLSPSLRNLLNDSETSEGIWKDAKRKDGEIADNVERAGDDKKPIKYRKLTATFAIKLVRILNQYLKATKAENMPDEDRYALLGKVEAHWDKTGEWTGKPLEDRITAEKAPVKSDPKIEPEAKGDTTKPTTATPNASSGNSAPTNTTPGNGKDGGMGRATKDGDPKPNEGKTVREAKDAEKPLDTSVKIDFATRETSAMGWLANHLSKPGMPPQLATLGAFLKSAQWVQMTAGLTTMAPDHIKQFDMLIRETFVEEEAATNATTN